MLSCRIHTLPIEQDESNIVHVFPVLAVLSRSYCTLLHPPHALKVESGVFKSSSETSKHGSLSIYHIHRGSSRPCPSHVALAHSPYFSFKANALLSSPTYSSLIKYTNAFVCPDIISNIYYGETYNGGKG